MNRTKQQGFTLVEIAIVLVIIGLLLGGILKGQELINSARVRNIADQASGYQAAYYGFIDRFRQVPGDWPAANATNGIGTAINGPDGSGSGVVGNGRIDANDWDEASAVWEQLSKAGFIAGAFAGQATDANTYTGGDGTTRAPVNAFNGTVALSRFENTEYQGAGGMRLAYLFGTQIPANIMRELDVKLDDGMPTTGVVRATLDGTGAVNLGAIVDQPAGADACVDTTPTPNIWDIQTGSADCGGIMLY